jgi:hypothetical protein
MLKRNLVSDKIFLREFVGKELNSEVIAYVN